jgi:hypothetical protein
MKILEHLTAYATLALLGWGVSELAWALGWPTW